MKAVLVQFHRFNIVTMISIETAKKYIFIFKVHSRNILIQDKGCSTKGLRAS